MQADPVCKRHIGMIGPNQYANLREQDVRTERQLLLFGTVFTLPDEQASCNGVHPLVDMHCEYRDGAGCGHQASGSDMLAPLFTAS